MNPQELVLTPSDFIAVANQTLEFAFGYTHIEGELANFRVSKNKWVYFDIKDDTAKVSCFASVYALPGPLEDGMMIKIAGQPRLHPQYGFSVTVQTIQPSGEGTLKKAFDLLKAKLQQEGLFAIERKRPLPYPPQKIALVASLESAAYADFIKIINTRWPFVSIELYDVQVQGEVAPAQLTAAIQAANSGGDSADVLVMTRGGGSADDLAAFNDERVVRAIAASRIPTIVAIGHEIDESLSELAADVRASTPSNAAELLAPDKAAELQQLQRRKVQLMQMVRSATGVEYSNLQHRQQWLINQLAQLQLQARQNLEAKRRLLLAYNPDNVLQRGYAIVRANNQLINKAAQLQVADTLSLRLQDGTVSATVDTIQLRPRE